MLGLTTSRVDGNLPDTTGQDRQTKGQTMSDRMTPNERICTICGNPYRIYGRIMCRECEEQVDWLGKPAFVEWPPAPPRILQRR